MNDAESYGPAVGLEFRMLRSTEERRWFRHNQKWRVLLGGETRRSKT
jgi:hypothetical protein